MLLFVLLFHTETHLNFLLNANFCLSIRKKILLILTTLLHFDKTGQLLSSKTTSTCRRVSIQLSIDM